MATCLLQTQRFTVTATTNKNTENQWHTYIHCLPTCMSHTYHTSMKSLHEKRSALLQLAIDYKTRKQELTSREGAGTPDLIALDLVRLPVHRSHFRDEESWVPKRPGQSQAESGLHASDFRTVTLLGTLNSYMTPSRSWFFHLPPSCPDHITWCTVMWDLEMA